MQVVPNVKGSFRTTGSGHNREVVALYRWPLVQVPLYQHVHVRVLARVCTSMRCVKTTLKHTYSFLIALNSTMKVLDRILSS